MPLLPDESGTLVLDNSTISSFRECRRKAYYRYTEHWVKDGPEPASLAFGRGWHAGLDAMYLQFYTIRKELSTLDKSANWNAYRATDEFKDHLADSAYKAFVKDWVDAGYSEHMSLDDIDADPKRTPVRAHNMFIQYIELNSEILNRWNLVGSEVPFVVPLSDHNDKYWYGGRMDKVVSTDEGLWLVEHKTTSLYSKSNGFQSAFADSFSPNSQIEGYMYALQFLQSQDRLPKDPIAGVMVDAALVHKQQFHFKRIPIYYDERLVAQWYHEVQEYMYMYECAQRDSHWLRNTDSCQGKYGRCSYIDLCKMYPDSDELRATISESPPGYVKRPWTPYLEPTDG
jgi:hypothetical protein